MRPILAHESTHPFTSPARYVCYFGGKPTLTRLTACFVASLEIKDWADVVCVSRGHFMLPYMERNSFLYHMRRKSRSHATAVAE